MARALSSLCLFIVLLAGGHAAAKGKDKIAILGLEVLGTTTVDSESTRVAQDLTVALRTRPKAGQGPYQWTPGSERELVDEKIMNNCPGEEKECMAKIGAALGADYLVYGKIERKQLGGQAGYQISLKLLKVASAQQLPGWTEFIPLAETSLTKLQEWARKGYKKLTNDFDGGVLRVKIANEGFDRGTILIDGEERGNITSGVGEVQSLPEGRYKLSIVAGGYERYDSDEKVTIRNGETANEEITLKKSRRDTPGCDPLVSKDCGGTVSQTGGSSRAIWKGMFVGGLVMAAAGGGLMVYANGKIGEAEDEIARICGLDMDASCSDAEQMDADFKKFDKQGRDNQKLSRLPAGGLIAVGGTLAVIGFVKGFVLGKSSNERVSARSRRSRSDLVVAPVVTDRSAGATLHFRW
jgi:hypothetical protein